MTAEESRPASPIMISSANGVRRILFGVSGIALAGVVLAWWLSGTFAGWPDPRSSFSAFYVLFARDEIWGLPVVAVFGIGAALFIFGRGNQRSLIPELTQRDLIVIALVASSVFAITALGTHFVCHDYSLSADEFMADFQARIFLRGRIFAEVPAQWVDAVRVIKPTFADYFPATHEWKATYLPVYAALRAIFESVYLASFLNPCLAALTVVALYGTARNIWPNDKQDAFVASLLLAGSAQFLVMAMTTYSMPAHLALNTVWLWLYSNPERRRFYLAPIVGVLAIGLHQPIVHALFATPFLLRLALQRKWRAVSIFALIYIVRLRRMVRLAAGILASDRWARRFFSSSLESENARYSADGSPAPGRLERTRYTAPCRPGFRTPLAREADHLRCRDQLSPYLWLLFFLLPRSGSWVGLPLFPWNAFLSYPGCRRRLESAHRESWRRKSMEFSSRGDGRFVICRIAAEMH